ncbi:hypothetical protein EVG20_g6330 [Dentipellis fragilis]|uniref:Uncharacterized protein n=1 Tax=Dentipellis fragilis TaxID=205917 RepID=A0A4Y9YLU8_9AGAM|nr:hypothetical protein EVG20_g6330 [Dentipellis fragilis]
MGAPRPASRLRSTEAITFCLFRTLRLPRPDLRSPGQVLLAAILFPSRLVVLLSTFAAQRSIHARRASGCARSVLGSAPSPRCSAVGLEVEQGTTCILVGLLAGTHLASRYSWYRYPARDRLASPVFFIRPPVLQIIPATLSSNLASIALTPALSLLRAMSPRRPRKNIRKPARASRPLGFRSMVRASYLISRVSAYISSTLQSTLLSHRLACNLSIMLQIITVMRISRNPPLSADFATINSCALLDFCRQRRSEAGNNDVRRRPPDPPSASYLTLEATLSFLLGNQQTWHVPAVHVRVRPLGDACARRDVTHRRPSSPACTIPPQLASRNQHTVNSPSPPGQSIPSHKRIASLQVLESRIRASRSTVGDLQASTLHVYASWREMQETEHHAMRTVWFYELLMTSGILAALEHGAMPSFNVQCSGLVSRVHASIACRLGTLSFFHAFLEISSIVFVEHHVAGPWLWEDHKPGIMLVCICPYARNLRTHRGTAPLFPVQDSQIHSIILGLIGRASVNARANPDGLLSDTINTKTESGWSRTEQKSTVLNMY